MSQRAPRFSYECLTAADCEVVDTAEHEEVDPLEHVRSRYEEAVEIDLNDPSIEMFPTDRVGIINTLRRLSERMPEDVTDVDDLIPPSPVVGPNNHPERHLPAPSPNILAHQQSPSLDSITEEHDDLQETLATLPEPSKLSPATSENDSPALSKVHNDSAVVLNGDKKKLTMAQSGTESNATDLAEIGSNPIVTLASLDGGQKADADKLGSDAAKGVDPVEETKSMEGANLHQLTSATVDTQEPSVELPQGTGEPELTTKEQSETPTAVLAEEPNVDVKEVAAETPPEEKQGPICAIGPHVVPSPVTPFVVGDKQLGHDDEVKEIKTGRGSPNIMVQPATPAASITKSEFIAKPDIAKSTAIEEENGRTQMKSRKSKSTSPERPVTPSSMRSAGKDAKSRNFLKAFWKVVFVDWIGGLIRALCGGGRRGYT